MSLDHEVISLSAQADAMADASLAERMRKRMKRAAEQRTISAYRALFLNADGTWKPEAALVIGDFSAIARLGVADDVALSDAQLREYRGRRNLALHIIARLDLDGSRLAELAKKLREGPTP